MADDEPNDAERVAGALVRAALAVGTDLSDRPPLAILSAGDKDAARRMLAMVTETMQDLAEEQFAAVERIHRAVQDAVEKLDAAEDKARVAARENATDRFFSAADHEEAGNG